MVRRSRSRSSIARSSRDEKEAEQVLLKRTWLFTPILLISCAVPSRQKDQTAAERGATSGRSAVVTPARPTTSPSTPAMVPKAAPARPLSCSAEIGAAPAALKVSICRKVSPATHPPCNAANSCALIEDEIARGCALLDRDGPPVAGCGSAPRSMDAAAAVIRRYYAALNARDFPTAWDLWGEEGRPGQSFAAFKAGFARTRSTNVTIGNLEPGSGAAGSVYQPVPVTVEATLDDGVRQRFSGTYVLRRVNHVDGASAAQQRWHIDSARLKSASAN